MALLRTFAITILWAGKNVVAQDEYYETCYFQRPYTPNIKCNYTGYLTKPSQIGLYRYATPYFCSQYCGQTEGCHGLSYNETSGLCIIYDKAPVNMGRRAGNDTTKMKLWNRACFEAKHPTYVMNPLFENGTDYWNVTQAEEMTYAFQPTHLEFSQVADNIVRRFSFEQGGIYICQALVYQINFLIGYRNVLDGNLTFQITGPNNFDFLFERQAYGGIDETEPHYENSKSIFPDTFGPYTLRVSGSFSGDSSRAQQASYTFGGINIGRF